MNMDEKAGKVMWPPATKHQPSNISNNHFEIIQVELKNHFPTAMQKSLRLFKLPDGVTEQQYSTFLSEMNKRIIAEGHPEAGYHLYKISDENNESYKYFMEGVWPDSETYDKIHNSESWKTIAEKGKDMIEKIRSDELYIKAEKVN